MTNGTCPYRVGDLLNHKETERAGFFNQLDILREEQPPFVRLKALSVTNGTCPYRVGDLLNHKETERAGFFNQLDILREEQPPFV